MRGSMGRDNFARGLGVLALVWALSGCASAMKDVGLARKTDPEMRSGPGGSPTKPQMLSPFENYRLVLAGNECRFFQIRVPAKWYWKLYVTASNEEYGQEATLNASFDTSEGGWKPLPPLETHKEFAVAESSSQGALGVANDGDDRMLTLRLCQTGAPIKVVMESQVSAYGKALLEPPLNKGLPDRPDDH